MLSYLLALIGGAYLLPGCGTMPSPSPSATPSAVANRSVASASPSPSPSPGASPTATATTASSGQSATAAATPTASATPTPVASVSVHFFFYYPSSISATSGFCYAQQDVNNQNVRTSSFYYTIPNDQPTASSRSTPKYVQDLYVNCHETLTPDGARLWIDCRDYQLTAACKVSGGGLMYLNYNIWSVDYTKATYTPDGGPNGTLAWTCPGSDSTCVYTPGQP